MKSVRTFTKRVRVLDGIFPSNQQYQLLLEQDPRFLFTEYRFPLMYVETPEVDLEILLKNKDDKTGLPLKGLAWREKQARELKSLFLDEYTAVDHIAIDSKSGRRYFIICIRNFDENDPHCLIKQVGCLIPNKM